MNSPVVELNTDKFQVLVDMRLYNKEVVTASIYKYSGQFYISQQIDDKNPNFITVVFESKEHNKITEDITKSFCNDLIDQQLRYNTNIQFGHIRDLIVEEAFKPINK